MVVAWLVSYLTGTIAHSPLPWIALGCGAGEGGGAVAVGPSIRFLFLSIRRTLFIVH